jgi:hypothetical protein
MFGPHSLLHLQTFISPSTGTYIMSGMPKHDRYSKADIDAAVALGREAREYVQSPDALWLDIVRELGFSLSARFKSTTHDRQMSDLDEAIACCREVTSKYSRR